MLKKKINQSNLRIITQNKIARYEYYIKEEIEAGLSLQGWEVKSLRAGKVNISNSYVLLKNGEACLIGAIIQPITVISSHSFYDPTRNRKLLLHRYELNLLSKLIKREGYTIVVLSLCWKINWVKIKIGVAKGKKEFNKRTKIKEREWELNKARLIKKIIR